MLGNASKLTQDSIIDCVYSSVFRQTLFNPSTYCNT